MSDSEPQFNVDLTAAEIKLLLLCQDIEYGRILDLEIKDGQPTFERPIAVERDHKYGRVQQSVQRTGGIYLLKEEQRNFITRLRDSDGCKTVRIHIQHGLPFRGTTLEEIA